MDKQTKNLVIIGAVALFFLYSGGYIGQPGTQAVDGGVTADGVTVYTGTPVVEWYAMDAITGKPVNPGTYRVTVGTTATELELDDTVNASIGDSYTICLMPNSTYYGKCVSGTVNDSVTKVKIETYQQASSPTIYINNDPENKTNRNIDGADNIDDGETMNPTICIQGSGANKAFGPDGMLLLMDWNTNVFNSVSLSGLGTKVDLVPKGHSYDTNENTFTSWEIPGPLTTGQTLCGTLSVEGVATAAGSAVFLENNSPDFTLYDKFWTRNSSTDKLELLYARETDGLDTNSVTNASQIYLLTS